DPARNAVAATVRIGERVTGIAAGAGAVWVTVAGAAAPSKDAVLPEVPAPLPSTSCSPVYGPGRPRVLIASDLPRLDSGTPDPRPAQMTKAIRLVLEQHHFRAGSYSVGYQACDDSTPAAGTTDPVRCTANAHAFAANPSLLALIGTYHSFCAGIELPITNASP